MPFGTSGTTWVLRHLLIMSISLKILTVSFLLLNAWKSDSQICEDSLKKICIERFYKDKKLYFSANSSPNKKLDIQESFDGYFEKFRIFEIYELDSETILTRNGDGSFTESTSYYFNKKSPFFLYIIDSYTGDVHDVKSYQIFNEIINCSSKKLSPLDRSYLYLLLNHIGGAELVGDYWYPAELKLSLPLRKIGTLAFNGSLETKEMSPVLWSKVKKQKSISTKKSIYLFVFMKNDGVHSLCRYNFIFDENANICKISKVFFKQKLN